MKLNEIIVVAISEGDTDAEVLAEALLAEVKLGELKPSQLEALHSLILRHRDYLLGV
jgi:hypothetical protein